MEQGFFCIHTFRTPCQVSFAADFHSTRPLYTHNKTNLKYFVLTLPVEGKISGESKTKPTFENARNPDGNVENSNAEQQPHGVYKNPRLMHACTSIVGHVVQLQTKDGNIWEGILNTFSPEFTVCLELVVQLDSKLKDDCLYAALNRGSQAKKQAFFDLKDIVRISVADVDLNYATKDVSFGKLATDADISGFDSTKLGEHRELESWQDDDGDDVSSDPLFSLDDVANKSSNQSGSRGWAPTEMFDYNERHHKVTSTYDEKLTDYTMPLQKQPSKEYRMKEKTAAAVAREIESNPKSLSRLAKEDGSDCEEEKFSAVLRPVQGTTAASNTTATNSNNTIRFYRPRFERNPRANDLKPFHNKFNLASSPRQPRNHPQQFQQQQQQKQQQKQSQPQQQHAHPQPQQIQQQSQPQQPPSQTPQQQQPAQTQPQQPQQQQLQSQQQSQAQQQQPPQQHHQPQQLSQPQQQQQPQSQSQPQQQPQPQHQQQPQPTPQPQQQPQTQAQPQPQPQTQPQIQPHSQPQPQTQPPSQPQNQIPPQPQTQTSSQPQTQVQPSPQQQQQQQQSTQQPQQLQHQQQKQPTQQQQAQSQNHQKQDRPNQSELVRKFKLNPNAKEFVYKPKSPTAMQATQVNGAGQVPAMSGAVIDPTSSSPMSQAPHGAYYPQVPIFAHGMPPHQQQHHAAQFMPNPPHLHFQSQLHYMSPVPAHFQPQQMAPRYIRNHQFTNYHPRGSEHHNNVRPPYSQSSLMPATSTGQPYVPPPSGGPHHMNAYAASPQQPLIYGGISQSMYPVGFPQHMPHVLPNPAPYDGSAVYMPPQNYVVNPH